MEAQRTWNDYTPDQKLVFLQSQRADLMRQMRRQIHTSRSTGGMQRYIAKIDKQIAELTKSPS